MSRVQLSDQNTLPPALAVNVFGKSEEGVELDHKKWYIGCYDSNKLAKNLST